MDVLAKIKPSEKERLTFKATTGSFLQLLNAELKDARAILGGSGAKDTWLAGNHDVDIFVLFNYRLFSNRSTELSNLLEPILRTAFPKEKISRVHGSRDYFQLVYQQFLFEVVPILQISSAKRAINITDVSPLHSKWVNMYTKNLKSEVRLIKQFCKAQGIYGAESYVGGFSGYVLEILIAAYGSFKKVLTASAKWNVFEVIDVEKHYKGKDALFELNSSKHSPLIVIDPVDKSRNAAAALTLEKLSLFKKKAREYLKKPTDLFFEKQEIIPEYLKRKYKGNMVVYLEVQEQQGKKDVIGSKLLKAFIFLREKLGKFDLVKADWDWNRFYFVLKLNKLLPFEERRGPPLNMKEAVVNFKKKNKLTYTKSGRIYAKIKVRNQDLSFVLRELFKDQYFKEKVKKVRICRVL